MHDDSYIIFINNFQWSHIFFCLLDSDFEEEQQNLPAADDNNLKSPNTTDSSNQSSVTNILTPEKIVVGNSKLIDFVYSSTPIPQPPKKRCRTSGAFSNRFTSPPSYIVPP